MRSFTNGVAIEGWEFSHHLEVVKWLTDTFGHAGTRWMIMHDYGLISIEMDEDVYMAYLLRWE